MHPWLVFLISVGGKIMNSILSKLIIYTDIKNDPILSEIANDISLAESIKNGEEKI